MKFDSGMSMNTEFYLGTVIVFNWSNPLFAIKANFYI